MTHNYLIEHQIAVIALYNQAIYSKLVLLVKNLTVI